MNNATWGFMKFSADASKCYEELTTLEAITPEAIVEYARNENTELHKCFQWDDAKAAENWRKQQARLIVKSLVVVVQKSETEVQTYRLIEHDDTEKEYRPIVFTVRNDDEYSRLLKQAKAELAQFRQRYKKIAELAEVIEEIEKILNG